ncbi:MAG: pyridoxal-phosphate dependent enzyme [Polyangiaceae bacterium]|nr:pyridoxal-phosphate dependent enzyme [Polyangiaceae bacterium]MCL4754262.1 pyridoxal-phosphate dependent enzyme [Myxococcales bacterium]
MKQPPSPLKLGRYPTPVFRADVLCSERAELWIKNDGLSAEPYGGNKVRKLELILAEAVRRGAKRIVTTGAGGSHHVLATATYARSVGIPVFAVLCPQPWTPHAETTLRASLGLGIDVAVVGSMRAVPFGVARNLGRGDFFVPAGGSSTLGTLGYAHAVTELLDQIRRGDAPEPDVIVAPLGSGGTVAGLLAGVLREGLRSRVVGVSVAVRAPLGRAVVLALGRAATRTDGGDAGLLRLGRALEVDDAHLGAGYGHSTPAGESATRDAASVGLELDPTYTAKTFARALEELRVPAPSRRTVLYWHTLSAAPLAPLLENAPASVPSELASLLPRGLSSR